MKKEHKSMRHRIQREILLLLCLLAFVPVQGQTYEELWAQVEAAQKKGLVQTANRYVLEINGKARKEVNFPQALRSVLMNFTLMADVKPEIRFDSMLRMKKWMRTVSDPADKRVLHLVLGGMYLNQCNRVYRGASYTEAQKADDPSKWDGPTFRRQILRNGTDLRSGGMPCPASTGHWMTWTCWPMSMNGYMSLCLCPVWTAVSSMTTCSP